MPCPVAVEHQVRRRIRRRPQLALDDRSRSRSTHDQIVGARARRTRTPLGLIAITPRVRVERGHVAERVDGESALRGSPGWLPRPALSARGRAIPSVLAPDRMNVTSFQRSSLRSWRRSRSAPSLTDLESRPSLPKSSHSPAPTAWQKAAVVGAACLDPSLRPALEVRSRDPHRACRRQLRHRRARADRRRAPPRSAAFARPCRASVAFTAVPGRASKTRRAGSAFPPMSSGWTSSDGFAPAMDGHTSSMCAPRTRSFPFTRWYV